MDAQLFAAAVAEGLHAGLQVLAFRALPCVVVLAGSNDCSPLRKAVAIVSYCVLAYLAVRYANFEALSLVVAYAYVIPCLVCAFFVARHWQSRVGKFSLAFALLTVVPALLLSHVSFLIVLIGWRGTMAVYSFSVDARRKAVPLLDYLFFVLVNPIVVFSQRSVQVSSPGSSARGLGRMMAGIIAVTASGMLSFTHLAAMETVGVEHPLLVLTPLRVLQIYLAQSGLAATQIGLMRLLGYQTPECYVRPFAATSPKDFWQRWNTYVGYWARVYVFQPLTRALRRRMGPSSSAKAASRALAVVVTFVCVGLLHDARTVAETRTFTIATTLWFAANGVLVVLWEAFASSSTERNGDRRLRSLTSRVLVMSIVLAFVGLLP